MQSVLFSFSNDGRYRLILELLAYFPPCFQIAGTADPRKWNGGKFCLWCKEYQHSSGSEGHTRSGFIQNVWRQLELDDSEICNICSHLITLCSFWIIVLFSMYTYLCRIYFCLIFSYTLHDKDTVDSTSKMHLTTLCVPYLFLSLPSFSHLPF